MIRANVERDLVGKFLQELIAEQEATVPSPGPTLLARPTPEALRDPEDLLPLVTSEQFNYEDGVLTRLGTAQLGGRPRSSAEPGYRSGGPGGGYRRAVARVVART